MAASGDASGASALEERMRRRQEEREKERGTAKASWKALNAEVDAFDKVFHGELLVQLQGHVDGGNVQGAVDCYRDMLAELQQACRFLPQWDKQRANETLAGCMRAINGAQSSSKKRFKFTREARSVMPEFEAEIAAQATRGEQCDASGADSANASRIINRTDETVHVSPAGSIFLSNLTRCKVLVKPIDGSVFVQGCRECTFVAAARQLRIHDTHDSSFYLHCVSEPIIEACTAVGFAPFTWDFDGKDATFAQTTLHNTTNLWDKVNDFKWLRSQHSPNWFKIPEAQRQAFAGENGDSSPSGDAALTEK